MSKTKINIKVQGFVHGRDYWKWSHEWTNQFHGPSYRIIDKVRRCLTSK